ncbi:MAG TPA: class I SAM-dependent methyltransferase, partial [Candidatus Hydrogenedentes bacterium]|nr:class I SAM-dependent methyltransferase [Candidatus Hydrogenedentota bacterium]
MPDNQKNRMASFDLHESILAGSSVLKSPVASSPYDDWALYYDVIHEGLPGDVAFYVNMALANGGKALELGTGTGRIAIPMAMAGIEVVGLDNSPAMLALCREKASIVEPFAKPFRLIVADMAAFDLGETFPFIAIPYRGFMHLLTREEQRGCLDAVRRHLAPDGIFALDTWAAQPKQVAFLARETAKGKPRLVGRYKTDDARVTVVHR